MTGPATDMEDESQQPGHMAWCREHQERKGLMIYTHPCNKFIGRKGSLRDRELNQQ